MPSPFPGMDPYLEAPDVWPDFHDRLAAEISTELNQTLPSPYYARLEMRPELGIIEGARTWQRIIPDVAVVRLRPQTSPGGTTLLERPRRDVSKSLEVIVRGDKIRHHFVEIRDSSRGHKLITLIEILSPSNKRTGPDREAYGRKQSEVLESDASLIEVDLLRCGERILPALDQAALIDQLGQPPDYVVLVNRAWCRAEGIAYQVFPCGLREWLPCIPVPLKEREPEVPLDLQFVFNRAYDGGPYRRGAVDYAQPPDPPLPGPDADWAESLLRDGVGSQPPTD